MPCITSSPNASDTVSGRKINYNHYKWCFKSYCKAYFDFKRNLFTNDLYVVGHVHELVPLRNHLLPELVVEMFVSLERDGQLSQSAEEEGGQGGGHIWQDGEQNSLCQRPLCPLALQDLNVFIII